MHRIWHWNQPLQSSLNFKYLPWDFLSWSLSLVFAPMPSSISFLLPPVFSYFPSRLSRHFSFLLTSSYSCRLIGMPASHLHAFEHLAIYPPSTAMPPPSSFRRDYQTEYIGMYKLLSINIIYCNLGLHVNYTNLTWSWLQQHKESRQNTLCGVYLAYVFCSMFLYSHAYSSLSHIQHIEKKCPC